VSFRAPKGTDDILPPDSDRWRDLFRVWDDLAERFGYGLVLTPLFESTEVFARSVGESTEVVQKQMYTFEDKGGRSLTLRPEQTASVVRAYLEGGRQGVLKGAYSGPMFRYERPQAGRRRQFYQLGVEYIGEPAPEADAEVVELGHRFLLEAGVPDLDVLLNSIGDAACRPAYRATLVAYLEERRDELCDDCRARMELNPLRVLDCKVDGPRLADAPAAIDHLCGACAAHLDRVKRVLDLAGIGYRVDPRLVRGLDYYTRTVFEYVPRTYEAAQNAVGGGGRYDGLAELLGGPPTPGVGLALGLDRILLAAGEPKGRAPLDLFVVVAGPERFDAALGLVGDLRRRGLRVDVDLGGRSVKAQFKVADRRGAAAAVVIGDEWEDDKVTVKDLRTGEERRIAADDLANWRHA
jgi:histidyl-tRNA synthetase